MGMHQVALPTKSNPMKPRTRIRIVFVAFGRNSMRGHGKKKSCGWKDFSFCKAQILHIQPVVWVSQYESEEAIRGSRLNDGTY